MSKKRAIIIISVVVAIVLIALAIFYFFFMKDAVPPDGTGPDGFPVGPDLPIGGTPTSTTPGTGPGGRPIYQNQPKVYERLRLLSSLPVSGATLFDKNAETFVRYVERAEGHIFEARSSKNDAPYRISNTTIPKIYEAIWVRDGEGVIVRYLKPGSDEIQTFYALLRPRATSTTGEQDLQDGTFLPGGLIDIAVAPNQDKIFYLQKTASGVVGMQSDVNGGRKVELFSSPVSEWVSKWPQTPTIVLTSKAAAGLAGHAYFLDSRTGTLRKVLGGYSGITTLPNSDASRILFSEATTYKLSLKLFDVKTQKVSDVSVTTLPEKCVWSTVDKNILYCAAPESMPAGQFPDNWYQGSISFIDSIWKINIQTGETSQILSPQATARVTMDIINLQLSEKEDYLLFTNKKDYSLWLLDLSAPVQ